MNSLITHSILEWRGEILHASLVTHFGGHLPQLKSVSTGGKAEFDARDLPQFQFLHGEWDLNIHCGPNSNVDDSLIGF